MFDIIRPARHPLAAAPAAGLVAALALGGCAGTAPGPTFALREAPVDFTEIGDGLAPAPDIEAMIAPYRQQLEEELGEVLGHAAGDFFKADPEGALDNLVADALLQARMRARTCRSSSGTSSSTTCRSAAPSVPRWTGAFARWAEAADEAAGFRARTGGR